MSFVPYSHNVKPARPVSKPVLVCDWGSLLVYTRSLRRDLFAPDRRPASTFCRLSASTRARSATRRWYCAGTGVDERMDVLVVTETWRESCESMALRCVTATNYNCIDSARWMLAQYCLAQTSTLWPLTTTAVWCLYTVSRLSRGKMISTWLIPRWFCIYSALSLRSTWRVRPARQSGTVDDVLWRSVGGTCSGWLLWLKHTRWRARRCSCHAPDAVVAVLQLRSTRRSANSKMAILSTSPGTTR